MATRTRCPVCNRFGSDALEGMCTPCHEAKYERDRYVSDDYFRYATVRPFFPEKFGIIKDKFGYER